MSGGKLAEVDAQIVMGIARLGKIVDGKLLAERMSALLALSGKCKAYQKEFANNPLILSICEKKIDFIFQAKTKADLAEILSPPKVRYNGNEVVPIGNFHVDEEELLVWSLTSLWCGGPLSEAGFNRYMKLFKQFYPELAVEIGIT